jgi:hypothetical protein
VLYKAIYMARKSYYICTKKRIVDTFDLCAKIIQTKTFPTECTQCDKELNSLDTLIDHTKKHNKQIGGNDDRVPTDTDFYQKYAKYKLKYMKLKDLPLFAQL